MVHIALVGAGLMGTSHIKSLQGNALVTVTGICDVSKEAAQRLADTVGANAYTDLDEMLAKETIDAVIVATPDNLHADPVIRCAKAHKHILCEKPFATTLEDGRAMLVAIEENGVICQMAHLFRFLPFYRNVANAVEKGQIGEVLSANLMMHNRITVPTKMLRWADRSSPSWFLLAHSLDMLLWGYQSKAVTVRAPGVKRKLVSMGVNTYDLIKAEMVLENSAICTMEANWVMPEGMPINAAVKLTISGTEGAYETNTGDPISTLMLPDSYGVQGILEFDVGGYYVGLRRHMLDAFTRTIEYGAPLVTNARDGYNALCVLEAIDRSMESGNTVVQVAQ